METEEAATATTTASEAEQPTAAATGTESDDTVSYEDNKPVYFEVVLKGGAPWGFSLKGGSEHQCPITIAKITAGGKASLSGQLECDDQVLAVNEVQCDSHEEAIQLVKSAFNTLHLSLIRGSPSDYKHGMKTPEYYHSTAQIYSKDMHHHDPAIEQTKKSPASGPINRRLKKRDSTNSPRPKSWHNAEASQHWKEREFQQQQQRQQQHPQQPMMQQVPRPMPQSYAYPGQPGMNPAPSMDSLMMQGGTGYPTKMLRGPNTQSMMSLHYQEKLEYSPEYMKKTMPEFRSSQDMNYYTKEREYATSYYGDKRAPFVSVNPAFRRVDLAPAETYPKVAVATQLQSAQQRAFIGRLPDASIEEPQEKHIQTFTSSRTVSYSTVQMPQKQYASTADFQPQYNNNNNPTAQQQQYPGFMPTVYSPTSPTQSSPYSSGPVSPGDKKTPPPLPVRGESHSRTLQIRNSEHMKSQSWPATTESSETYNSEKPDSVISTADLPPVRLSPSQEYPQRKISSNSSSSVGSLPMESNYYHDDTSAPKSPGIYTAKPYFIEDSATDINPWFTNEQKNKDHSPKYSYKDTNPPSPPTRDIDPQRTVSGKVGRGKRRSTSDSLTGAYQTYLEEMLQQEEHLKDAEPPPSTPATPSPDSLSQTAPLQYGPKMHPIAEDHISRTMAMPQEASVPITNRWTEERNKKNHLMGQMDDERPWQSPADFKQDAVIEQNQKPVEVPPAPVPPHPVDPKEEEWQMFVKTADSQWEQRNNKNREDPHSHVRELSQLDEKSLTNNTPRLRSPINKTLVEAVGSKEDISGKSFSRMIENSSNVKKESRDVRNSGNFTPESENPFRNSDSNDKPKLVAGTFSSEDWSKMSEMDNDSGSSIMSQLRNSHQTPFSAKYVNGEPVLAKTERSSLAEQKQSLNDSNLPPELPPRSQSAYVPPQLPPRQSTGHSRAESFDLDLRTNSSKASYPAKRADVPSDSNSTVNHTRAHSFTSGYNPPPAPYAVPSEPTCTSIPEEQGSDTSDVPPPLPPRKVDRDKRSTNSNDTSGPRTLGSTEELSKTRSDRGERRVSDPRAPEPIRRQRLSDPRDPRLYWAQHQYSKSDSEKYQRVNSNESWHKMSDPSGAIRKQHKVSDPDEKRKVQEALRKFYHEKTSSQDSGISSRPSSICDFGDHYSSMSSIPSSRPGSVPADQLGQHHRVFTSQTSLSSTSSICRDSGISSPTPANWAPHSPPQMSNKSSPEYDQHHAPLRYSTSLVVDKRNSQGSEPRSYDHRNPPWLSNEIQGRKSTPVTRSSSMSVKPGRRDPSDYSHRSYDGNIGLSRTDSFTHNKTRPESTENFRYRSGSDSQKDKRRRQSREERKSREERHRILSKEEQVEEDLPKSKWSPPKQSPLVVTTKDQSQSPLSETRAQVQQAERKPISKVGKDCPESDEDEELVAVEERVIAQKASQQHTSMLRKKEDHPPVFRFPSPPLDHPQNQRSTLSSESPRKEALSLPSPPTSPPSTQLSRTSPPKEETQHSLQAPQKKPLCQVNSFVLPPPPSPSHEGSIYIDHEMDFPPPPPEVLADISQFSPPEGRLSQTLPVEFERKGLIDMPVCWNRDWKKTADKLATSPTNEGSKPIDTTPCLSPESSVISTKPDHQQENHEPLAPRALQEDSDIDSDTVEGLSQDSVEEIRGSTPTKRTQVVSPIFIPDDVSEPQHEVRVIERPTELPLLTPSPRRPSQPDELCIDESDPRSPVFSPKDTCASGDSGIGIIDFVIKSLTPCQCSDLIDLFPESDRKSEKRSKMPHSGENSSVVTPKRSDHVEGPPTPSVIPSSLYLQLSPGKALLLTRAKGMQGTGKDEIGEDSAELRKTKEELIIRITRKVEELKSMHKEVQEEITSVETIGKQVSEKTKKCCKASEFNKYTMYVEDVERVTKLLLSLSRRLAKVDSVLSSLDNQDEEQNADLETMKQNLERKYNDAKGLKNSIDKRHNSISKMLKKYLNEEEHEDFCHYICESPRQHIMAQELDDKIQLGEEQLQALTDSLRKADSNES